MKPGRGGAIGRFAPARGLERPGPVRLSKTLLAMALIPGAVLALSAGTARAAHRPPVPDYSARRLGTQEEVSVKDLKGQVLLLNTWATWCVPCREEMPDFEAIHGRYGEQGLRVIGVNIDQTPSDRVVSSFAENVGVSFEIWRDPRNRFAKSFRVLGPPETFLVTKDGRIAKHWRGPMDPNASPNLELIQQALGLVPDGAAAPARGASSSSPRPARPLAVGFLVAFGAGLLSVLSPCVLPLIPSYVSVMAGLSARAIDAGVSSGAPSSSGATAVATASPPRPGVRRRVALQGGLLFVAGFSLVFIALGAAANLAGGLLADNRVWISRIGGAGLVLLGLHLLGVLRIRAADREMRFALRKRPTTGLGAFFVGVVFAAGWTPCIGPVLAAILALAATGDSVGQGVALLAVYSAGLAIPFLAAALSLDRFLSWSARLRRGWLPVAERVSGVLVVGVGVLLLSGTLDRLATWFD